MIRYPIVIHGYINAEDEDEAQEILDGCAGAGLLIERAEMQGEVWRDDPHARTAGTGVLP